MTPTNAENQRAYRQRKYAEGDGRLSPLVSATTRAQLARLARHHGLSQREVLEKVIGSAERDVVRRLKDSAAYFEAL